MPLVLLLLATPFFRSVVRIATCSFFRSFSRLNPLGLQERLKIMTEDERPRPNHQRANTARKLEINCFGQYNWGGKVEQTQCNDVYLCYLWALVACTYPLGLRLVLWSDGQDDRPWAWGRELEPCRVRQSCFASSNVFHVQVYTWYIFCAPFCFGCVYTFLSSCRTLPLAFYMMFCYLLLSFLFCFLSSAFAGLFVPSTLIPGTRFFIYFPLFSGDWFRYDIFLSGHLL